MRDPQPADASDLDARLRASALDVRAVPEPAAHGAALLAEASRRRPPWRRGTLAASGLVLLLAGGGTALATVRSAERLPTYTIAVPAAPVTAENPNGEGMGATAFSDQPAQGDGPAIGCHVWSSAVPSAGAGLPVGSPEWTSARDLVIGADLLGVLERFADELRPLARDQSDPDRGHPAGRTPAMAPVTGQTELDERLRVAVTETVAARLSGAGLDPADFALDGGGGCALPRLAPR